MDILMFLLEVVKRTPLYAWVILAVLIKRGLNASKDNVLSFPKMFIFPAVFMVWELEEIVTSFTFPVAAILTYGIVVAIGALPGYVLYQRLRRCYRKEGVIYRSGTYMPMVVMMLNFLIKYVLNIAINIDPRVYGSIDFNLFYSVLCGFLVGIFVGGILQAYREIGALKV